MSRGCMKDHKTSHQHASISKHGNDHLTNRKIMAQTPNFHIEVIPMFNPWITFVKELLFPSLSFFKGKLRKIGLCQSAFELTLTLKTKLI